MVELGAYFGTIKSLLIFFAPVLIPRAINFFRTLRVVIAHRPPSRPLPPSATRALNVLFCTIVVCLVLTLPFSPFGPSENIFTLTRSRLNTSTDVLFNRLARRRPQNSLTPKDNLLRAKLVSLTAREVYLRFGPETLIACPFCSLDNVESYLLYHLPFNILLPHLMHMLIVGIVTSAPFAGREAALWRNKFTLAGLALASADIYAMVTFSPLRMASAAVRAGQVPPSSFYCQMTLLRPFAFMIFDGICALVIYLSATNRFFFVLPSQIEQADQLVSTSATSLSSASSKLHALSVVRNAVVRDKVLKNQEDNYWRTVVAMESENSGTGSVAAAGEPPSVWEEEEVVRAMSRAMAGQGGVNLVQLTTSASQYVNGVTAALERTDDASGMSS